VKRKYEMVSCHNAKASSFVAEVRGKAFAHFHAFTLKCHSNMLN
jgi:hypothetical protein